jgi:PAS domain S-box-containing protein
MNHKNFLDPVYAEILEAAPDAVLVSNSEGQILFANQQACSLFGYSSDEFYQMNIDRLVPAALRGHHRNLREKYFKDPRRRPIGIGLELIGEKKDGNPVDIEICLNTLRISDEMVVISIVRDATLVREMARDLNRRNIELKRSNEDLERFAAIASHDLQEPLRMIGGYTQLLQKRYHNHLDQDGHEYLGYIYDGVKRLQNLIQDLLTFSRLTSKARPFVMIDLNDIVSQVKSNLYVLIDEKKATVTNGNLPPIMADPVQMTQLFQNLISNSLKFCEIKPVVQIVVKQHEGFWQIGVIDNGIGIPQEFREKVFGIFQRLHSREAFPGTGVGLAICKRIIERHQGSIWIEDSPQTEKSKSSGTAIWMSLPSQK